MISKVLLIACFLMAIQSAAQNEKLELVEVKTTFYQIIDTNLLNVLESTLDTLPCIKEPDHPGFFTLLGNSWAGLQNLKEALPEDSYWVSISTGQIVIKDFDSESIMGAVVVANDTLLISEFYRDKNILKPVRQGAIKVAATYSSFPNDSLLSNYESIPNTIDYLYINGTFINDWLLCR